MAKQEEVDLIETFTQYTSEKGIDRETLVSVLEESFRSVISKIVGTDDNYLVIINPDKGNLEIYRTCTIVEDDKMDDPVHQISLSDVIKIELSRAEKEKEKKSKKAGNSLSDEEKKEIVDGLKVGDEYTETVDFSSFGRRAVLNLRQTLSSKILDLQKDNIYNKYKEKVGAIVTGEVYQAWKKEVLIVDEDGNEMLLPKSEQIPTDSYRKGDIVMAVVAKVDNQNNDSKIILSRTSPVFLQKLFERDVPEIADGLITIKKIARIPGERAKIAVESYDERIDPVGACVGVRGARIHGIVRELRNENIDVIQYSDDIQKFVERALSPARVDDIKIFEDFKRVDVVLHPDEVSKAIGKGGSNIKLASMLTEYQIEVYRNENPNEEDILLDEFLDEIDSWVIETLKKAGYMTARDVLRAPRHQVIDKTDLEEETIDDVLSIINEEFAPVDEENETADDEQ